MNRRGTRSRTRSRRPSAGLRSRLRALASNVSAIFTEDLAKHVTIKPAWHEGEDATVVHIDHTVSGREGTFRFTTVRQFVSREHFDPRWRRSGGPAGGRVVLVAPLGGRQKEGSSMPFTPTLQVA